MTSEDRAEHDEDGQVRLQGDLFRIRLKVKGGNEVRMEDPPDWKTVWTRVQRHLRRIAVDLPGVVADFLSASRSALSGASKVPAALAARIERGRQLADAIEEKKAAKVQDDPASMRLLPSDPLEESLERIRALGFSGDVVIGKGGAVVVTLVRPGLSNVAAKYGQALLGGEKGIYDAHVTVPRTRQASGLPTLVMDEEPSFEEVEAPVEAIEGADLDDRILTNSTEELTAAPPPGHRSVPSHPGKHGLDEAHPQAGT